MFRILVTGASGLIGRRLCREAIERGYTVYAAEHSTPVEYGIPVKLDLLDADSIAAAYEKSRPDVVVHAAAMTNVDMCEKEKEPAYRLNHGATVGMAAQARRLGSFFVYISTDYVFDGNRGMYKEDDEANPINVYGDSKLRGEEAVMGMLEDWCILRLSTPYGKHNVKKTFPELVIDRIKAGQSVRAAHDQYTSPTYVPNFCRIVLEVVERGICGILHASGSKRISRLQLAIKVARMLGIDEGLIEPASLSELSLLARRPRDSSLDVSKASSLLREKPIGLDEGLKMFIEELGLLGGVS